MAITRAVLVLWQADPRHPDKAAAPLVYALCARALDMEVEIHLTSSAVAWAFEGVAAAAYSDAKREQTILSYLQRCHELGVKIYMCGMALAEHHRGEPIIAEITGQTGATAVMAQLQREDTRVLIF
ncbi:MAG: DsrE family protein [Burkholderiaceae bacterium]|jgi:predicted peroxiredoxin